MSYRKLNIIYKRNRYFLSFIEEIIKKIINYKHFIHIITIFIKLYIDFNNENLTIFIIIFKIYKYKMFFFRINELIKFILIIY